jgi:hypothetical protein
VIHGLHLIFSSTLDVTQRQKLIEQQRSVLFMLVQAELTDVGTAKARATFSDLFSLELTF